VKVIPGALTVGLQRRHDGRIQNSQLGEKEMRKVRFFGPVLFLAFGFWIVGCSKPASPQAPQPPVVTTSKPVEKEIVDWSEFTGRTAAVNLVNVTPRVSGYIVDIPFKEGDLVHKGDLLFQIDPRPYRDAFDQSVGQLKQAEANQQLQDATFERQQHLRDTGVIAREDFDTALSNKNQASAQVVSAQAAVNAAQLNLEFTRVTSPIDGRVSRQLVNIGNLVQADSTQLTTIVSVDPIYAYFSMDELASLKYQRLIQAGKISNSREGKVAIYLQLQDETGFPHTGTIDFSDNSFDSSTGTILIRGSFPATDSSLIPGAFVRVRLASSPKYQALLVADRAIGSDQGQSFLYVVDGQNIARLRQITVGQLADGLRVVKTGLKPDDVVVINGIIKVRPDSPVKPEAGEMEQFLSIDDSLPVNGAKEGPSEAKRDEKKAGG
jgi:RND family efflux transporter MFP subunit